jgi:hypothetical protein
MHALPADLGLESGGRWSVCPSIGRCLSSDPWSLGESCLAVWLECRAADERQPWADQLAGSASGSVSAGLVSAGSAVRWRGWTAASPTDVN